MISERDRMRARNLMRYARKQGLDPVAVLDTYGLLLTEEKSRHVTVQALREFQQSFEQWQPHEFARRIRKDAPISPAEMLDAMTSYLTDYIKLKEQE